MSNTFLREPKPFSIKIEVEIRIYIDISMNDCCHLK